MREDYIYPVESERADWSRQLDSISKHMCVIDSIIPVMKLIAQWTQVLSSKTRVSILLVRLMMIRRFRKAVDDLIKSAN